MDGYKLTRTTRHEDAFAAPRRMPGSIWWGVGAADSVVLGGVMLAQAGYPDFSPLVMAEGALRATINVFKRDDVKLVTALHAQWYPAILEALRPHMQYKALAVELGSRLGAPFYEMRTDKVEILELKVIPAFLAGDYSMVDGAVTCINLRLQNNEPITKVRQVPVISDGKVSEIDIDESKRRFKYKGLDVFAGRARNIYFASVCNNFKQPVDNMIHDAILTQPGFHHNMYADAYNATEYDGMHILAFDVKHFERHMGAIVVDRAKVIGAGYDAVQRRVSFAPYLSWDGRLKEKYLVEPDRSNGYEVQLASGDSCVSAVAKEIFIALYAQFALEAGFAGGETDAIAWALKGGDRSNVRFKNYGDDNFAYAQDPANLDKLFAFMARYLTIEKEDPPAFLGWEFILDTPRSRVLADGKRQVWCLRARSYFANFYKPERAPGKPFRPFFWEGKFQRRETFRKYGDADSERLLDIERDVLDSFTLTEDRALLNLEIDRRHMKTGLPLNFAIGKEYLLTDEEKLALGRVKQIPVSVTRTVVNHLMNADYLPFAA